MYVIGIIVLEFGNEIYYIDYWLFLKYFLFFLKLLLVGNNIKFDFKR